jgi:hypothetical protein
VEKEKKRKEPKRERERERERREREREKAKQFKIRKKHNSINTATEASCRQIAQKMDVFPSLK